MKIANTKTKTTMGISLNDKDYMNRILCYLKDMEKNYTVALTEASNEILYQRLFEHFKVISTLQRNIYEVMFQNGWYELETVNKTTLENKLNTINTDFNNLA